MATPVRILLVGMPAALRELVAEALAGQPDMTVVGEAGGPVESGNLNADVVMTADDGLSVERLRKTPGNARVVTVGADGRATLREPGGRRTPLGELSARALASVARAVR
jgi:chemotaxis response regulator CheB